MTARRETELNCEADTMLAGLGLAGREDSSADKISLGQSKRVAIARAVAAGARILFLDEPLAGLDRQGINDVLELLETLIREQRVTLVIIEHVFNQPHLHGLVTTDWLLDNGKIERPDGNGAGDDSVLWCSRRNRQLGTSLAFSPARRNLSDAGFTNWTLLEREAKEVCGDWNRTSSVRSARISIAFARKTSSAPAALPGFSTSPRF